MISELVGSYGDDAGFRFEQWLERFMLDTMAEKVLVFGSLPHGWDMITKALAGRLGQVQQNGIQ